MTGRLCTMMLFLLLTGCITGVVGIETITLGTDTNLNLPENDYIIQSPDFPNAYGDVDSPNNVGQIILNAPAEAGAGYYLFFTEFMISEDESIIISDKNSTYVLSGSEFTKRGTAAYIYTEGNVLFQIGANSLISDDHTGFQIIAKRHGANEIVGTSYNDTTNLDELGCAYFFVSPAYPATNGGVIESMQTFMSNNSIRVLLYDFDFYGTVTLTGTDTDDTEVKFDYTGFQTNTSTVANYFLRDVTINVECKRQAGCGRYFLIVESYLPKPPTIDFSNFTLTTNNSKYFSSDGWGVYRRAYPNNYHFYLNLTAPESTDQKIVLSIKLESEASSDGMSLTGLVANPAADNWRLTGTWNTRLFAETNNLQLSFTSDGVGRAVGFSGYVSLQSCKCPEDKVLETNSSYSYIIITSPGYSNDMMESYCPGLNCQWSYKFAVNHIFSFETTRSFKFRDSDFLRISDHHNNTIVILSNSNKNNTRYYADSGIVHFHFVTSSDIVYPNGLDYRFFWIRAELTEVTTDEEQFIDQVTFVESYFGTTSYLSNITIVPPFTLYDLSAIPNGLLSFYTNDSSYDVLSPVISSGLTSYSANASSLYVQYFLRDDNTKSDSFVRYLVGPSDMFTNVGCSIPSVVTIEQNASLNFNLEAQSGKCVFRLLHNASVLTNASLAFSFDQLHDRAGVEIFSGDGGSQSVKLDHVPEYLFGEMVTVQYSGSPGNLTVRSVPPSNRIVLLSNCTPAYALMPGFNENAIKGDYNYYISALNTEKPSIFYLTTLSLMDEGTGFDIIVWMGNEPSYFSIDAVDIKINKTLVLNGTRLTVDADNFAVRRLYFSVAICEDKPGSAIGKASHIIILSMTTWTALWNYYGFAL